MNDTYYMNIEFFINSNRPSFVTANEYHDGEMENEMELYMPRICINIYDQVILTVYQPYMVVVFNSAHYSSRVV